MPTFKYLTADVFTNQRFGGNQLAVFPEAKGLDPALMQKIAREFNFSETTFVLPPQRPQAHASRPDLHAGQRAALCGTSDRWDGVRAGHER